MTFELVFVGSLGPFQLLEEALDGECAQEIQVAALGMNSCGQHRPAQGWEGVGHAEGLGYGEWGGTVGFYQFVATQKSTLLDVCL